MDKAKEISALWKQIKPQIGELARLCHEVESHAEVTADAYQRGYEAGLNDAWGAARKIVLPGDVSGIYLADLEEIFDRSSLQDVIKDYSPSEAIEKIRQYEQEKEEQIQVGDEVICNGHRCVVLAPETIEKYGCAMDAEGGRHGFENKNVEKTGRYFAEIAEVLAKMKETDNG